MTSWQGQRIDTTSTHGTGCTLASAIALFLAQGSSLADAVARAREFVRIALHEAPGLGQGAGPIGQAAVRLDVGAGPRLNQVTVTGTQLPAVGRILPQARAQADRRQSARLRALRDRRRRDLLGPDRPGGEDRRHDRGLFRVRRPRRAGRAAGPQRHSVRARPAQPAMDVARSAAARSRRQHHLSLQGRRSAPLPAVADADVIHMFRHPRESGDPAR